MSPKRFRRLVDDVYDRLPEEFRGQAGNVAILIENEPTEEQIASVGLDPEVDTLFGLFEGVPLPERSHDFAMELPDRILLFYGPLTEAFPNTDDLRDEIRVTLVHELGHYFGLDEDEIENLGFA